MKKRYFSILSGCAALFLQTGYGQVVHTIYAQSLIDDLIRRHPDVLVAAMHVTAPGAAENTIIATNLDRVGNATAHAS